MSTLFQLAREAAKTNKPEDIEAHKNYEALCLQADEIIIGKMELVW
jgi:hypothetical protein